MEANLFKISLERLSSPVLSEELGWDDWLSDEVDYTSMNIRDSSLELSDRKALSVESSKSKVDEQEV